MASCASGGVEPLVLGEERLHHLLQLAALPRRQALHQRLHLRHLLAHLLEELIQVLHAREVLAPLVLEGLKVRLIAFGPVAEHAVQVLDHLAHALHVLRGHVRERVLHALHEGLEHLLAERLEQLLEHAPGLGVHELVVLERLDAPGGIGRELVELGLALGGHLGELAAAVLGDLAALRALPGIGAPLLDPRALGLQDLVDLLLDVVEGRAEVVALELLLAPLAELLEQVLKTGHPPLRHLRPALEEPLERLLDVAVGHEVVGHRLEQVVGVEVPDVLRAVPARVADSHAPSVSLSKGASTGPLRASPMKRVAPAEPALGLGCLDVFLRLTRFVTAFTLGTS